MVIKKALSPCSPGRFKRGITIHNYKRLWCKDQGGDWVFIQGRQPLAR
jgi:hypothetical protein